MLDCFTKLKRPGAAIGVDIKIIGSYLKVMFRNIGIHVYIHDNNRIIIHGLYISVIKHIYNTYYKIEGRPSAAAPFFAPSILQYVL